MNPLMRLFNLKGGAEDGESLTEWAADEITTLHQRLKDCEGAIDRREQFIAQANSERDSALDAEVVAWAEVDSLKSEVKRLRGVAESEIMGFMAVAVEICRQEADEWDSDRLQTLKNYAEVCGQRIEKLMPGYAKAHILNKQADAIEATADAMALQGCNLSDTYEVRLRAQRLRNQADELEKGNG